MESSDKGRSKKTQDIRLREDVKNGRRGKRQVALYRPGSGPLRKSEEFTPIDNGHHVKSPEDSPSIKGLPEELVNMSISKPSHSLAQLGGQQSKSNKSNTSANDTPFNKFTDNTNIEPTCLPSTASSSTNRSVKYRRNSLGNISSSSDQKRRNKKPEQARYVPKLVAQANAERDVLPKNVEVKSPKTQYPQQRKQDEEEEDWNDNSKFQQNQGSRNVRSQKPDNWGQNSSTQSKYEGNRRGGRGNSERNWPSKDLGNGHPSFSNTSTKTSKDKNTSEPDMKSSQLTGNRRNHQANEGNARVPDLASAVQPQPAPPRELRQASEPRALPPTSLNLEMNRMRDTRSVEPAGSSNYSWQSEKLQAKPPSGRRGSGRDMMLPTNTSKPPMKQHPNFESLPPRLRKKYLLENGLADPASLIGKSTSEDTWDGSTVTFQGAAGGERGGPGYHSQHQHHPQQQFHPHHHHHPSNHGQGFHPMHHHQVMPHHQFHPMQQQQHQQQQQHWSNTLPARARGRGRLRPEELEMERVAAAASNRFSRSLTPDRLSMPPPALPDTRSPPPGYASQQSTRAPSQQKFTPPSSPRRLSPNRTNRRGDRRGSVQASSPPGVRQEDARFWRRSRSNSVDRPVEASQPEPSSDFVHQSASQKLLDWGDEVEESERLEAEKHAAAERGQSHLPRDKKKRRKKRGGEVSGTEDRSLSRGREYSRDRNYRGHSRERFNRNNSRERPYRGHSQDHSRAQDERGKDPPRRYNEKERNWRQPDNHKEKSVEKTPPSNQIAGIIILPTQVSSEPSPPHTVPPHPQSVSLHYQSQTQSDSASYPMYRNANQQGAPKHQQQQRQLFNPNNPTKPIMVSASGPRATPSQDAPPTTQPPSFVPSHPPGFGYTYPTVPTDEQSYITDQFGISRPTWYDPYSPSFRAAHNPHLLLDIERADLELHWFLSSEGIFRDWSRIVYIRHFLQQCLLTLLTTDIKFCQTENVEQHLWKILFYNIIELLRKGMAEDPEKKDQCKQTLLTIIDEGTAFLESLLEALEVKYKFKLETYLTPNHIPTKGLNFAGLALVSAQKLYLFLGDLARYKEQVNETTNFGKSRQYYIKAQRINPKNGRPYNQLAILSVYARRKLDAVYYYMRSLMASNPFLSAKDSLVTLFDENRKKYEQSERKRREERESRLLERMKEKEGAGMEAGGNGLRREYWVRPEGGRRRLHITSSTVQEQQKVDSEEEELNGLSSTDVNKRFVTSYLNVHGKLFSKVGMETFQEAALQMLREFRALLQHSPIPLNSNRFLQLLALNMFAIDNTQLKDAQLEPGYRSAAQENALIVSIQMFNLLLEKCVSLLRDQLLQACTSPPPRFLVNEDMLALLPAVKVWCDWLLCHGGVWNPPPSCLDYRVGPAGDAWSRLATLVNLLMKLDNREPELICDGANREGYDLVRLAEDATLCGFTPLMYNTQEPSYARSNVDMEVAQVAVRIGKIIFFGAEFLCGVDPPVIKLQKFDGASEYVSVVQVSSQSSPSSPPEEHLSDGDLHVESFSEDEEELEDEEVAEVAGGSSEEIAALMHRKEVLERRNQREERHRQRVQAIIKASVVSVEIEVKPHYLVPDTNCFIDYLAQLQRIAQAGAPQPLYTLMVPLVVLKELEGLSRGGKGRVSPPIAQRDQEHVARVAECAKNALVFLRSRHPGVRCVTSRGTILATLAFTMEEDTDVEEKNDDRILTTALNLSQTSGKDLHKAGEPRRLYREVVLLTEDRNLRVKALARDMPVREVPVFLKWADLG